MVWATVDDIMRHFPVHRKPSKLIKLWIIYLDFRASARTAHPNENDKLENLGQLI